MRSDYFLQMGETISCDDISNVNCNGFEKALHKFPYAHFRRAFINGESEGIEFDLEPETVQYPVADIKKTERLSIEFPKNKHIQPRVYALRKDFPTELSHLNLTFANRPRSLCLFEQNYSEVVLTLTPERLLLRIFNWLNRAIIGKLHLEDQPLEPFLLTQNTVIIDDTFFSEDHLHDILAAKSLSKDGNILKLQAVQLDKQLPAELCFIGLPILTKPWHSRVIKHTPNSILELHDIIAENDCGDILGELIAKTRVLIFKKENKQSLNCKWLILLRLPKTRKPGGQIESTEDWAFMINDTIGDLGCKLGVLGKENGSYAWLIESQEPTKLDEVSLDVCKVNHKLNRKLAQKLSGIKTKKTPSIVAIGGGAIGSQVIMNLSRQGFGYWQIIDYDNLLPHNTARHALLSVHVGHNKAEAIAYEVNEILNEKNAAKAIDKSVFDMGENNPLFKGVDDADLVFDFSASKAVLYYLSNADFKAKALSFFMLMNGKYLVSLCEDNERKIRLSDLELQLNVASLCNRKIAALFIDTNNSGVRYGGACSDISTILSQDVVSIYSGIVSAVIKRNFPSKEPSIDVWKLTNSLNCQRVRIPIYDVVVYKSGGWNIRISKFAIKQLKLFREEKLPNETGGVLVGAFDVFTKTIYINLVLKAPADSKEWPTSYIRGVVGLKEEMEKINSYTGGCLSYVGEWHSHPKGCRVEPSGDDLKALDWLHENMAEEGLPAVMCIKGDNELLNFLIR